MFKFRSVRQASAECAEKQKRKKRRETEERKSEKKRKTQYTILNTCEQRIGSDELAQYRCGALQSRPALTRSPSIISLLASMGRCPPSNSSCQPQPRPARCPPASHAPARRPCDVRAARSYRGTALELRETSPLRQRRRAAGEHATDCIARRTIIIVAAAGVGLLIRSWKKRRPVLVNAN